MAEVSKQQIKADLIELCGKNSDRHPGSRGNQRATAYTAHRLTSLGLTVSQPQFKCLDWEYGEIVLTAGGLPFPASISPFSLPCDIQSPFVTASSLEELRSQNCAGKIALLHGELCKEQLAPKNFTFYNPEHHQQIIKVLEQKKTLAIIAITGKNPDAAGAVDPFPLIEDADFNIPVANLSIEAGEKLLQQQVNELHLRIESNRIPSSGCNVLGLKPGKISDRLVFCAHIDTKKGTPGALDNGGSVVTLLALAGLLQDYSGKHTIELLINNGEDYYAYPGGMQYLADNIATFDQIALAINADGVGLKGSRTTYCSFNASEAMNQALRDVFHDQRKFTEREPWYQSDHMLFAMNNRPAVALVTEAFSDAWANIAHTAQDTIDLLDIDILADTAIALRQLIDELNRIL